MQFTPFYLAERSAYDRETIEAHVKGWQEAMQRTLTIEGSGNEPGQGSFVWLTIKDGKSGSITLKTRKGAEQVLTIKPEEGWKVSSIVMNGNDVTSQLNEDDQFVTPIITSDTSIIIVYEEVSSAVRAKSIKQIPKTIWHFSVIQTVYAPSYGALR